MNSIGRDELRLISNKLTFSPDYTRFRSVCKSWRSSAPKRLQLPWLIARDRADSDKKTTFFKFYQLSFETNKFLPIPELSILALPPYGPSPSSSSTNCKTDCIGYSHGWMALFNRSTSSVSLFNPLTNSSISLPLLKNLSERLPDGNIGRNSIHFYLTSDPGESLSNCFALVNAAISQRILYCKVGCCDNWIEMPHPEFDELSNNIHVCSYRGKTFIASHGDVFVCDFGLFGCNQISLQKIISFSEGSTRIDTIEESYFSTDIDTIEESYLIESDGDLLLVLDRYNDFSDIDEDCSDYYFQVFKLELGWQSAKTVLVKSLGDKALFLSPRTAFSLTASKYPGCKRNSIYSVYNDFEFVCRRSTQKLCIYDFGKGCTVTVDDNDDPPLYVDWENCCWFAPSLLK